MSEKELMKQEPRILIAIPTLDYVNYKFTECLTQLQSHSIKTGLDITIRFEPGTLVHLAREHLAQYAIDMKYTHVFWLDADMVFERSALNMLLNENVGFISGIYRRRRPPYDFTLYKKTDPWEKYIDIPGGVFPIAACGYGCVLMETRILQESMELFGTCFKPVEGIGEDLCFCKRVERLGEAMYGHGGVRCGHITQQITY